MRVRPGARRPTRLGSSVVDSGLAATRLCLLKRVDLGARLLAHGLFFQCNSWSIDAPWEHCHTMGGSLSELLAA